MHRIFSEEERARLDTHPAQRAAEALDRGDVRSTRLLALRLGTAHYHLYFGYLHWIARMLGGVYRRRGVDALHRALRESVSVWLKPALERFPVQGWGCGVRGLLLPWRSDLGGLRIREEPGRVVVQRRPCGAGGRLLLEGWCERLPHAYPRVREGHALTRGQAGFPVFCTACEAVRELSEEALGYPLFRMEGPPPGRAGGRCTLVFPRPPAAGAGTGTAPDPVFPGYEVPAWEEPLMRRAGRLLRAGRLREARRLFELYPAEWQPLHDILAQWSSALLSVVYRAEGPEGVARCLASCYDPVFQNAFELMKVRDDRANIESMAEVLHTHYMGGFRGEEEEDRFTFHLDTCGSGGMLLRRGLCEPHGSLARLAGAHAHSFSMAGLPVYCTHCAGTNRVQIRNGGPFGFVTRPGNFLRRRSDPLYDPADICRFIYFKGLRGDTLDPDLRAQVHETEGTR